MTHPKLKCASLAHADLFHQDQEIPEPLSEPFVGEVSHPHLYLWDAWSADANGTTHLYCLAVSRNKQDGTRLEPAERNSARFHIRHFESTDDGATWTDRGCFQQPRPGQGSFDSRTLWSGSILPLANGRILAAYTGVREQDESLLFQQSLGLALSDDWNNIITGSEQVFSDALSDRQMIVDHGYFLGEQESLGHKDGESNGPILAWRDPFLFEHDDQIHVFWGAKIDNRTPALGHGLLTEAESGFAMNTIFPPVAMPDGAEFTQLELPKIIFDESRNCYYLIVASCNRQHEGQSDADADKRVRMYVSDSLDGAWQEYGHRGSILDLEDPHMFGITIIAADFTGGELHYIAPFTEQAGMDKYLTLSSKQCLDLNQLHSLNAQH